MAGLFDNQAAIYVDARPRYPSEWFSMLAALTPQHSVAWDAGTGNGQAAIGAAEHYKKVIATDISEEQLKHAIPHPQVHYLHTPSMMSDDELVHLLGGENSVDLITVASAVHWFDLEKFYPIVKRVLRKPGGIFVHALECYKTLPFPFESVGVGCEGQPLELDMEKKMSFEGLLKFFRSCSAFNTAKRQGVDLLSGEVVEELESAWGGAELVRTAIYKTYMLAGKVKL
ncbi:hypothetical protein SADUNF_Sadunf07G0088100 [Salix dunnii]|uniref:Methyltransferase type 11 domain-containing protein n=1 Tax=Salix dunnii TaxID=1413687 RepID=A0A835MVI7_9ROSI|nr:hypothetical protein SADUNF_Sadunf07G0088100 [Salix dunnii]